MWIIDSQIFPPTVLKKIASFFVDKKFGNEKCLICY